MALLIGGRFHVETAAGVAVSGGKMRIYNAGTTTLSSVYSDAALTVPLTNPVVAASDGWTPQIFAAEGLAVDFDFLTAGDVVIAGQSGVSAVFAGASGNVLTRDFTNSRMQVRGSGGIVYYEAGDPTGDNIGGKLTLSGWNGTTADEIEFNGPTNVANPAFTVEDKKIPGVIYTPNTTFSAVTVVDIPLTNAPSGVRAWDILIWDLVFSADASPILRFSYDNGATYKSGAADYTWGAINLIGPAANNSTGATSITLATNDQVDAGGATVPGMLELLIVGPNSGTASTSARSILSAQTATTPRPNIWMTHGRGVGGYGRPTHVRLTVDGVITMTGAYKVIPQRGTGE